MFLLVNPPGMRQGPWFDVPTNILYLVAALRKAGVSCDWIDGNMVGMDGVRRKIDELSPQYVGISCLSPVRFNALDIAAYADSKGAITVMGGHHPHWMWRQIFDNYPFVDVIVFGEGEQTIVDLATNEYIDDISGIAYRSGGIYKNAARKNIENLDDIAFPAWDLVNWDAYHAAQAIGPRVFYSRGCTGRCKFCNAPAFWRGYRHRSPQNFCEELEWLFSFRIQQFVFGDDDATESGADELFNEILKHVGHIPSPACVTTRVDAISPDLCKLMAACGVNEVCLGVESGSQHIMDHLGKGITVEQAKNAVSWVKDAHLKATVLLINNTIGERPEDKEDTRRFLGETRPDATGGINALWLHPCTRYYDEVRDGKYDDLVRSGKELVNDNFFLDRKYAQQVIAWKDGNIFPMRVTDHE